MIGGGCLKYNVARQEWLSQSAAVVGGTKLNWTVVLKGTLMSRYTNLGTRTVTPRHTISCDSCCPNTALEGMVPSD
ncbi:Uncharacterized protein TCM_022155 [Theobroma cacao]|uniref:Uncharacterized protein n=1 Tax=Theobroma cacao TaxID=3641 RepID=A0A061ESM3_THECC|nr:Uncharacterized protein TCM_022155 [Theobroma cacao]